MIWLNLLLFTAIYVVVTCCLYKIYNKRLQDHLSRMKCQCLIGICYGLLSIIATEFGIHYENSIINIRNAAPLTAGLIFGGPSGILAGFIGGAERWLSPYWGGGFYTQNAGALATVICGFVAAAVRKYLLDDKKPSWAYALAVAISMEVLHMLLIFATNISDLHRAFIVVNKFAFPMILMNGVAVMASTIAVSILSQEKKSSHSEVKKLSQIFQLLLFICVSIGFVITSVFTYRFQTRVAETDTEQLLYLNLNDVKQDIHEASDHNLLSLTKKIAERIPYVSNNAALDLLAAEFDVAEINVIDSNGIVRLSTDSEFFNYDMASGEQSAEFLVLLDGTKEYVQNYMPTSYDKSLYRKYAGVALREGGFVQVGYDASRFQKDIDEKVLYAAKNRHIGQNGSIIICDASFKVISDGQGYEGQTLDLTKILQDIATLDEFEMFLAERHGVLSYCAYTKAEGYFIVSVLPYEEAMFTRDIAVYLIIFLEILVFAAIFACIYFLIKKLIVNNIRKINQSLSKISGGDLDELVNVRSNEEFASLSDDINKTVVTLKRYIDEAEARMDQELQYAQTIQYSALPSVFPPYPHRKEFDIYANMDPAKEVGGDFYDFYLLDENRLAILIADVAGKGIPASLFMMKSKAVIKSLIERNIELTEAFVSANDELCEGNEAEMFVTVWMGILDLKSGKMECINAGHVPPVIKRKDGIFEYLTTKPNLVLGFMDGVPYNKFELELNPGDTLYLYTDGVPEAHNEQDDMFGEERLITCLNSLGNISMQDLCNEVIQELKAYVGNAEQFDDITMLGLHLN